MTEVNQKLIDEAKRVREFAYAPYSHFAVGAAVMGGSGEIYGGCNVENASFSVTNCAERTAIYKAIAAGERELVALSVVAEGPKPVAPCGACRQVIAEFNIPYILMANLADDVKEMTLEEILPGAFSAKSMGRDAEA